jgi:hypothetical protein
MTCVRGKNADDVKFMYDCGLCGLPFQFGPHVYMGQSVNAWEIMVCRNCIQGNHDGIVEAAHPHLIEHLNERGIEVKRYSNGRIAWPDNHGLRF